MNSSSEEFQKIKADIDLAVAKMTKSEILKNMNHAGCICFSPSLVRYRDDAMKNRLKELENKEEKE